MCFSMDNKLSGPIRTTGQRCSYSVCLSLRLFVYLSSLFCVSDCKENVLVSHESSRVSAQEEGEEVSGKRSVQKSQLTA